MLDLQPRVHLEKIKAAGPFPARRIDEKLDRAGACVADRARRRDRRLAHRRARRLGEDRRGALLDHLLPAPLQRAVALEQMDDGAVAVAEHLHLDVARLGDEFLDQHPRIAEGVGRLARRRFERRLELDMGVDPAHAAPAAAGDRLDQHRIADLVGFLPEELRALVVAVIPGRDRDAELGHQRLGGVLETERAHRRRRRADEGDARLAAQIGKVGVLGQEAVAGMDALGADALGQRDDRLAVEIAVAALADLMRLVGEAGVQRAAVGRRRQRDRPQAEPPRGARHPAGDLAAIGDQHIGEHRTASPAGQGYSGRRMDIQRPRPWREPAGATIFVR